MKRANDLEKLLGGWAAGTLTEAERRALMEAALEDQSLFNLLADEQALKETLEDQTLRRRIHAAVQEQHAGVWHAIWHRPWTWAAAAGMVAASVLLVAVVRWDRAARQAVLPSPSAQIARTGKPESAAAAPAATPETQVAVSRHEKGVRAEPQRSKSEPPRQFNVATLRGTGGRAAVPPPPALAAPAEAPGPAPSPPPPQKPTSVAAGGVVGGTPGGVIGGIIGPPAAEKEKKADVVVAEAAPAGRPLTVARGAFQAAAPSSAPAVALRQRAESPTRAPAPADLRVRHRILRRAPDGKYVEADTKNAFRHDDSLRLAFQANENAHVSVTTGAAVLWSGIAYQNKEQQVFVPAGTTRLVITASPVPGSEQRLTRASLVAEPAVVAEISLRYE